MGVDPAGRVLAVLILQPAVGVVNLCAVVIIGNRASGKMGYALAEAARNRGAEVTLVTAAPLPPPPGMTVLSVNTAAEMEKAVRRAVEGCQVLIMAAAVADYAASEISPQKIKKSDAALTLKLERTPDILAGVRGKFLRVGFAAESQDLLAGARAKLVAKGLDLIVANDITKPESTFGADTNRVSIIARGGVVEELPVLPKPEVARRVMQRIVGVLAERK